MILEQRTGVRLQHVPYRGAPTAVLAVVNGEVTMGFFNTPTVIGHFQVYSKTPGTNSHGMVDSNYFIRGYAIHGYAEVPTYAASHGCLRVPIPDAAAIYGWVREGTPVDVYNESGGGSHSVRGKRMGDQKGGMCERHRYAITNAVKNAKMEIQMMMRPTR